MRSWPRTIISVSLLALGLAISARCHAQAFHFDYRAPAECPNLEAFQAAVSHRLEGSELAATPDDLLNVRIETTSDGYTGTVAPASPGADAARRRISARNCSELVDALSLVVVVVFGSAPTSLGSQDERASEASSEPPSPEPAADAVVPSTTSTVRERPSRSRWSGIAVLGASVDRGMVPTSVVGPRLGAALAFRPDPSFAIAQGLSATLPATRNVSVSGGVATLQFEAFRSETCGTLALDSTLSFGPCFLFEIGRLKGSGEADTKVDGSKTWWSPGALIRGQWEALGAFGVYGDFGVEWPLVRSTFYFKGPAASARQIVVYEVPARELTASLGVALRFF